jgi:molybdopterin-guanine dinucleotide biosynthesis protein MobB
MVPILSVVGRTNSGKTTLMEKLIPELRGRGYRVGTLKHDVHGFDVDHEGKDTWRHTQAGAEAVGILSPTKCAVIKELPQPMSLNRIAREHFSGVDIVLTEGFKREDKPRIEVYRSEVCDSLLCKPEELFAVVSDVPHDVPVPVFGLDDAAGLADLIVTMCLKGAMSSAACYQGDRMTLKINGKVVSLTPFVQQFMIGALTGMVGVLRDVETPETLQIEIAAVQTDPRSTRREAKDLEDGGAEAGRVVEEGGGS